MTARLTPDKRGRIEKLILAVMGALDPTGANAERCRGQFHAMTDPQLEAWLQRLASDEDAHLYCEATPYRNEPTLACIEAAAKVAGCALHQYVYFRHDGAGANPVRTRHRVPVGYVHVRRLQQILAKKTSYSTDPRTRSQVTGQLTGDAAVGRLADEEAYALKTVGAEAVLRELLGPRADNRGKRLGMYQQIDTSGVANYTSLVGDAKDQATLAYLDALITASGLRSDLVDQGDVLRVTVDRPPGERRA